MAAVSKLTASTYAHRDPKWTDLQEKAHVIPNRKNQVRVLPSHRQNDTDVDGTSRHVLHALSFDEKREVGSRLRRTPQVDVEDARETGFCRMARLCTDVELAQLHADTHLVPREKGLRRAEDIARVLEGYSTLNESRWVFRKGGCVEWCSLPLRPQTPSAAEHV